MACGCFERALAAFQAAGYAVPSWVKPRYYLKGHHQQLLTAPERLPPVELHFALSSDLGGGLDSAAVLERSRVQTVGGRAVRVMEPEDEFVYLATHAAMHAFAPMGSLLDLKLLALRAGAAGSGSGGRAGRGDGCVGLDAGRVWQRAREGEVSVAVAVAVELARDWAGLALELPGEASWRVRLARGLFPDGVLAEGFYSPERHKYAAWVPALVMTDRVGRAARSFAKNFARGAKRHLRKRVGRWVPEEWGD